MLSGAVKGFATTIGKGDSTEQTCTGPYAACRPCHSHLWPKVSDARLANCKGQYGMPRALQLQGQKNSRVLRSTGQQPISLTRYSQSQFYRRLSKVTSKQACRRPTAGNTQAVHSCCVDSDLMPAVQGNAHSPLSTVGTQARCARYSHRPLSDSAC